MPIVNLLCYSILVISFLFACTAYEDDKPVMESIKKTGGGHSVGGGHSFGSRRGGSSGHSFGRGHVGGSPSHGYHHSSQESLHVPHKVTIAAMTALMFLVRLVF